MSLSSGGKSQSSLFVTEPAYEGDRERVGEVGVESEPEEEEEFSTSCMSSGGTVDEEGRTIRLMSVDGRTDGRTDGWTDGWIRRGCMLGDCIY